VRAEVREVAASCEQEGQLRVVELGLAGGGAADEAASLVVVVFGELARLPAVQAAGSLPQGEG
jgi:hypothetical protein